MPDHRLQDMVESPISRVKRVPLNPEEVACVFAEIANGMITHKKTVTRDYTVYSKMDRLESGEITYFHYWIMENDCARMYKYGSGGYIPLFHESRMERVHEFELKWLGEPPKPIQDGEKPAKVTKMEIKNEPEWVPDPHPVSPKDMKVEE